jgi:hypothetical protein
MLGAPHALTDPHIFVSNGLIHSESVALFDRIFHGEYPYPMPSMRTPERD